ncbi:MAG: LysE family transporter [Anaerolineales bacterium]|nr:LysE family transporter [Chloroflexota bacterium]MBL6983320.1 LysE family transporter [Anaerolineales bacterium]
MTFLIFLSEAVLISLSGVMAPGPITAVAVGKGNQSPHAGALVAIGHGLVEFPLMAAVFFGVGSLLDAPYLQAGIGIAGGLFILWMGISMLRSIRVDFSVDEYSKDTRSPILAGILFSVGNPYFLVWWLTVGAALILRSVEFGVWGFLAFGMGHWLCDLLWDWFLSAISFKGGQFFGNRFQQTVFALSGVMLLFFGGRLMYDAISGIFA